MCIRDREERSILKGWSVDLVETANTTEAEKFWNKPENLAAIEEVLQGCSDPDSFMDQVMALKATAQKEDFWREQHEFDEYVHEWEIYSDIFQATHGRIAASPYSGTSAAVKEDTHAEPRPADWSAMGSTLNQDASIVTNMIQHPRVRRC